MKHQPTWRQWLALVVSAGALVATVVLRQQGLLTVRTEDPELAHLQAERAQLANCSDAALSAARGESQSRAPAGAARRIPSEWQMAAIGATNSERAASRLSRVAPVSWSEIIHVLAMLLSQPGVRLQSLEIWSHGSRQAREIAAVEIVLEQPTEPPSRSNPSAGKVVHGLEGPAKPPAAGPGLSLGVPDGYAEPPPPVPAIAPSRPTPRGPRTGTGADPNVRDLPSPNPDGASAARWPPTLPAPSAEPRPGSTQPPNL